MNLAGVDADSGRNWHRGAERTETYIAVVRSGVGHLALERDPRPQSICAIERGTPKYLVVRMEAGREGNTVQRALLVFGVEALQTKGPGVDRVGGTAGHHPAVIVGGRIGCRRIVGMEVVMHVGARHTDRPVAEANLEGRPGTMPASCRRSRPRRCPG